MSSGGGDVERLVGPRRPDRSDGDHGTEGGGSKGERGGAEGIQLSDGDLLDLGHRDLRPYAMTAPPVKDRVADQEWMPKLDAGPIDARDSHAVGMAAREQLFRRDILRPPPGAADEEERAEREVRRSVQDPPGEIIEHDLSPSAPLHRRECVHRNPAKRTPPGTDRNTIAFVYTAPGERVIHPQLVGPTRQL